MNMTAYTAKQFLVSGCLSRNIVSVCMGRLSHATVCLNCGENDPQILVTGGISENNRVLDDLWMLDVNSEKWREVRSDI